MALTLLFLVAVEANPSLKTGHIILLENIHLAAGESKLIRSEPQAACKSPLFEDALRDERLLETINITN